MYSVYVSELFVLVPHYIDATEKINYLIKVCSRNHVQPFMNLYRNQ